MPSNKRYIAVDRRIGERVLRARRRTGLTQHEVAELVPMSPTAFNRLERGLQSVTAECMARLARILGVSSDSLLGLHAEESATIGQAEDEDSEFEPAGVDLVDA